jgi:hypothetical protein
MQRSRNEAYLKVMSIRFLSFLWHPMLAFFLFIFLTSTNVSHYEEPQVNTHFRVIRELFVSDILEIPPSWLEP